MNSSGGNTQDLSNTRKNAYPSQANPIDELLTVKDVASLLRVPISWVYHRVRKRSLDRLPGIRLGKYWRFRQEDITNWLHRQRP
jgi:excisionase family DNA binding protein